MSMHEIRQKDKNVAIYDVLKFLIPGSSTDKVKKRLEKAGSQRPEQYHALKQHITNIRGFGRGVGTPAIHVDHLEDLLGLLPSLPKATAAQLVATLREHVEMGTRVIQITAHKQYLPPPHPASQQASGAPALQHGPAGVHPAHLPGPAPHLPNGTQPASPYPLAMQPALSCGPAHHLQAPPPPTDGRKRKAPDPGLHMMDFHSLLQRAHHLVATVESSTTELKQVLGVLGQHYHPHPPPPHHQASYAHVPVAAGPQMPGGLPLSGTVAVAADQLLLPGLPKGQRMAADHAAATQLHGSQQQEPELPPVAAHA